MAFELLLKRLPEIQDELRSAKVDGWLLYDLHARNTVTAKLTGLGDLTRRYFIFIPAQGEPQAISHKIEDMVWAPWKFPREKYSGWRELDAALRQTLARARRVVMETSPNDAVPALDLVPAGVVEMVRSLEVEVLPSGDLVSRFYSAWSAQDLASHRRSAAILRDVAHAALERIAQRVQSGESVREGEMQQWIVAQLGERGAGVGAETIVARGPNAANPHYAAEGAGAELKRDDVVLIDLWSKESEQTVYADQTWMGYLGAQVPDRIAQLFEIVTGGRDAAVRFLQDAWRARRAVTGGEVDDVTRGYITERGYGHAFIHRTGHSIDQATHGMGPNIDNLETHETRRLLTGVAFSIEPGIYLANDVGMRSEINVYMSENGPEVTPSKPQTEMLALLPS